MAPIVPCSWQNTWLGLSVRQPSPRPTLIRDHKFRKRSLTWPMLRTRRPSRRVTAGSASATWDAGFQHENTGAAHNLMIHLPFWLWAGDPAAVINVSSQFVALTRRATAGQSSRYPLGGSRKRRNVMLSGPAAARLSHLNGSQLFLMSLFFFL